MSIDWCSVRKYEDITYDHAEGIARIAINRPQVRNAFRPQTIMELIDAFSRVREDPTIGAVILTGSPAGVGMAQVPPSWLRPGDVMEVEIDGIGILRNRVEEEILG